ncbi:MAG: hypothetical protein ACK5BY_09440 [Limnohabitans sp.]|jgi:hypothetical protein|uniref:hypothetical protein n=1 Tax=Limnohabitans sp. TaxID=1907725 RepID=UPI00391D3AA5
MNYKNDLIETSRSHLGLGVDIGRAALQPVYVPIEKLSEANLCDWVASALVGHCIQYHEGLLLRDRSESSSDLTTKDRARIHSVARRAWIACELGLVHLFSQKVGDDHYRYIAMRSSSPLKPPEIRTQLRIAQMAPSNPKPH